MTFAPTHGTHRRRTAAALAIVVAAAGLVAVSPADRVAADPAPSLPQSSHPGPESDDYFIGANYFGGWKSGDNFHFEYLDGRDWRADHPELEPRYGWYEDTQEVMDQQIIDASANGLDYFVFDWYPERPAIGDGGELGGLHIAMDLFQSSPQKPRMQFMINYINGGNFHIGDLRTPGMSQADYEALRDAEWDTITSDWVELFLDPAYVKIDGAPVIEIYDVQKITSGFSTGDNPDLDPHQLAQVPEERAVLTAAIDLLKTKAAAAGFPDVKIGGGLQQPGFTGEYVGAHDYDGLYDFFAAYAWHDMKRVPDQDNNYYNLIRDNHDYVWDYYAAFKDPAVDYVPVLSQGWDNIVHPDYNSWTIDKSPESFGIYLGEMKSYLDEHPQTNLAPGTDIRMAIIGSWNELFEGHYFLPTKADGDAYTRQVSEVFGSNSPDVAWDARLANLTESTSAMRAEVDTLLAASPGQLQRFGLRAVAAMTTALDTVLATVADADTAVRAAAPLHKALQQVAATTGVSTGSRDAVTASWAALVGTAHGLTVTAGADDYSVTVAQDLRLTLDVGGDAAVSDVSWTIDFPDTWPGTDIAATGRRTETVIAVPAGIGAGTMYNVSDMFPGPGTTMGNRQDLVIRYGYTVDGVRVTGTTPVAITVVPDLTWRVIENPPTVTGSTHSIWIHNVSPTAVSGTLAIPAATGVTISDYENSLTIAPGERLEVPVTVTNNGAADASLPVTFAVGDVVHDIGSVFVSATEASITTTASLDGAARSDGSVEVTNTNGRLQVGNAVRATGNTEYRPLLSFPLESLAGTTVSRVTLDLTEFESGNPAPIVIDHLAGSGSLSVAQFDAVALDTTAFPITTTPGSGGTHRRIDVTAWVLADLAAGNSHSTFRIRLETLDPAVTSYRVFRPTEYTPTDLTDAPQLKVVVG